MYNFLYIHIGACHSLSFAATDISHNNAVSFEVFKSLRVQMYSILMFKGRTNDGAIVNSTLFFSTPIGIQTFLAEFVSINYHISTNLLKERTMFCTIWQKHWKLGVRNIKFLLYHRFQSSLELSLIEFPWHKMKTELRENPVRTVNELKMKFQEILDNVQPEEYAKLIDTMPYRVEVIIASKYQHSGRIIMD